MEFDPRKKMAVSQPVANGLCNIVSDANGVHGQIYACMNNLPMGHIEVHAGSVEGVKLLMGALGKWVAQNETRIVKPTVVG